ncbi:MAG: 4-alpha-glucanotransferase [Puniceicoccales bacterium]|jgi:4-alpha-glucanotransferase|nr:4-alpha-glucanotransferase [Puniceicoccales bacterium]
MLGWVKSRGCGIFLHISSLPSSQGIGCFGKSAYDFVEFLKSCGMKYWQFCPLHPTSFGDSPYQSPSAFAGNQYFLDLEDFVSSGLLEESDLNGLKALPNSWVSFGELYEQFWPILEIAFQNFLQSRRGAEEFENYCQKSDWWLGDYSIFMALKSRFSGKQWTEWPAEFSHFESAKLSIPSDAKFIKSVLFHKFLQWQFDSQWKKLKSFANGKGISLIGDVPIFVGADSADVWANGKFFKLRQDGTPQFVAGVPPDAFSETGQLWGNPVYDWKTLENDNFSWWGKRIKRCLELCDVLRLDHFRGFCSYWEIPTPATDATGGRWIEAPGVKFFECLVKTFPSARFIAEDLGVSSEDVAQLMAATGLPGMNVMHFAFDGNNRNKYLPHEHEKNSVLYLGTHDNNTTWGWFLSLPEEIKHQLRCYLRTSGSDIAWDLIKSAYGSPSKLLILNLQDILSLGEEARFNTPSTQFCNWQWRVSAEQISKLHENKIPQYFRDLNWLYAR